MTKAIMASLGLLAYPAIGDCPDIPSTVDPTHCMTIRMDDSDTDARFVAWLTSNGCAQGVLMDYDQQPIGLRYCRIEPDRYVCKEIV